MYQVLYRRLRPLTFSDVVAQPHVTETLRAQVAAGRLSHAYLFTGTRGTGKTTCAKILSRAVNCENPVDGDPCNKCAACRGILSGSVMDVIEMDAASNNGVDQIRDLRDEIVYTPSTVKKRVYIIDEVHMLSNQAFNALLKTLEEPPEHVLFILATTEMHKVPPTILSRCQRFSFRRIPAGEITKYLLQVAKKENMPLSSDAAALIARLSDGAMRDALSMLDQCALAEGEITLDSALRLLGLAGGSQLVSLAMAVGQRDTAQALSIFSSLYASGRDIQPLLDELGLLFRDLLMVKTMGQSDAGIGSISGAQLHELSGVFNAERLIFCSSLIQNTLISLSRSSVRRVAAELCLISLCDETLSGDLSAVNARLSKLEAMSKGGVTLPSPSPSPSESSPSTPPSSGNVQSKLSPPDAGDDTPARFDPLPEEVNETPPRSEASGGSDVAAPVPASHWPEILAAVNDNVSRMEYSHLSLVSAYRQERLLTLTCPDEFTLNFLRGRDLEEKLRKAAMQAGYDYNVRFAPQGELLPEKPGKDDKFEKLLALGEQFDNFNIKE